MKTAYGTAVCLAAVLLACSRSGGSATARQSSASTHNSVAALVPEGAVGVLFDPELRGQQRNPHAMVDGDSGFFALVREDERVRFARVRISVSYSDYSRTADYAVDPPAGAKTLAWSDRAVDEKFATRLVSELRGKNVGQLGRACWLGPLTAVRVPYISGQPDQTAHAPVQIAARPDAVVFLGGEHSLELQCDSRADDLEAAISSLLVELKLTW